MKINQNEMKSLKQLLEQYHTYTVAGLEYQAKAIMEELFEVVESDPGKFEFKHTDIRNIFFPVRKKLLTSNKTKPSYEDYEEFQGLFNVTLYEILTKQVKPFDMDNGQIINWARKRCFGKMVNEYTQNDTLENHEFVTSHLIKIKAFDYSMCKTQEEEISLFEDYSIQQFRLLDDVSPYQEFLESVGGIEKLVTPEQLKIIEYKRVDMKQVDISKELNMTEREVSDQLNKAYKKIRKEYLYHRSVSMLLSTSIYQDIVQFMEYYKMILDCEGNEFDYFTFLLRFLKKHYTSGEQNIKISTIHKNKRTNEITIFDIVTDGKIHRDSWEVVYDTLEGNPPKGIKSRQKMNIVKQVIDIFEQYIADTDKLIRKINNNINYETKGA